MMNEAKPNYGIPAGEIFTSILVGVTFTVLSVLLFRRFPPTLLLAPIGVYLIVHGVRIWRSSTLEKKFRLREEFIRIIQPREGDRVLDVGTGRGLLAVGFAKVIRCGEVVGIDIWSRFALSGNTPENAVRNAEIEGVKGIVRFETADARKIPYPDGYFDVVVASFVIHTIRKDEERRKALREMIRVLKKGGKFAIAEPFTRGVFWTKEKTEKELSKLGLKDIKFHPIEGRWWTEYIAYGVKA